MSPLLEHDPISLCPYRQAPSSFRDNVKHSPAVPVSAVDSYFARGLQAVVADIMRMSGWELSEPLQIVHRRGMVCVVMAQWEGTVSPWRTLPAGASLAEAYRVLSALLKVSAPVPTKYCIKADLDSPVAFTWREQRVLQLLRKGRSQTEVGIILGLSVKTVNAYKQRALRKLGLKNNRQLQYWLLENLAE